MEVLFTFLALATLGVVLSAIGVGVLGMDLRAESDGWDVDASLALVDRYLQQGRLMEALVVTKKTVSNCPHAIRPRAKLVEIYRVQGKLHRAIEEAIELCTMRPDSVEAARLLADLQHPNALGGRGRVASSVGGTCSSTAAPALRDDDER